MKHFLATFLICASTGLAAQQMPRSFTTEVSGNGSPVILIPGLGCSSEVWRDTVTHLNAAGFETHSLTIAGFGGSKPIDAGNLLQAVQDDLARYIEERHLVKPVIIGHSLGGFLALSFAARHPDAASKVVSVDGLPFLAAAMMPGATPEGAKQMSETLRTRLLGRTEDEARAEASQAMSGMITSPDNRTRELQVYLASDRVTIARAMSELVAADLRPELSNVKCPILVLASWIGYKDYGVTRDAVEHLVAQQFATARRAHIILSDTARHFIPLDSPEWFFQQIDEFLKG